MTAISVSMFVLKVLIYRHLHATQIKGLPSQLEGSKTISFLLIAKCNVVIRADYVTSLLLSWL